MSKKRIDSYLPFAHKALIECKIADNNEIVKTYRGHISTFGAAITMGSLIAAVAFFSANKDDDQKSGSKKVDRPKLMHAIHYILLASEEKGLQDCNGNSLFNMICGLSKNEMDDIKDKVLDAAVALKLAMNLFVLKAETAEGNHGAE